MTDLNKVILSKVFNSTVVVSFVLSLAIVLGFFGFTQFAQADTWSTTATLTAPAGTCTADWAVFEFFPPIKSGSQSVTVTSNPSNVTVDTGAIWSGKSIHNQIPKDPLLNTVKPNIAATSIAAAVDTDHYSCSNGKGGETCTCSPVYVCTGTAEEYNYDTGGYDTVCTSGYSDSPPGFSVTLTFSGTKNSPDEPNLAPSYGAYGYPYYTDIGVTTGGVSGTTVNWTSSGQGQYQHRIQVSNNNWASVAWEGSGGFTQSATIPASLSSGTYKWRVAIANSDGNWTGWAEGDSTFTVAPPTHTLNITNPGTGSGSITPSTGAGSWLSSGGSTTYNYNSGLVVTLTATPTNTGSTFSGWSGSGCSGTGSCTVTMDGDKSVTATFATTQALTTYALSVAKAGNMASSAGVYSSDNKIDLGRTNTVTVQYAAGTVVNLSLGGATWAFTGWSGACSGTAITCAVAMDAAKSVTATFNVNSYALLTVTKTGTGSGTVGSVPAGIDCGSTCSYSYDSGTSVTLTRTIPSDSVFTGWSGGGCSGTGNCTVTMDAAKNVTANFNLNSYALTVTKDGTGSGTITSSPGTLVWSGNTGSASYNSGTSVTLTRSLNSTNSFVGWSGGGCSGTAATCTVAMYTAKSVTATFNLNSYALTVVKTGTGSGAITSAPAGINCGTDCTEAYNAGTSVTLTAAASTGSTFTGWSGGGCSGTAATCTVVMNAIPTVTATFNLNSYTVSYNANGATSGTVPASQAKIYGTDLTLQTNSGNLAHTGGYTFAGWNTATNGTGTGYSAGGTYSTNAAVMLYPKWTLSTHTLTVNIVGVGYVGSMYDGGGAISCMSPLTPPLTKCSMTGTYGTAISLDASNGLGYTFTGWSGCTTIGVIPSMCGVSLVGNTTVTANFNLAIPTAPSSLTLSAQANCTSVNLSWTDNSSNETGFKIERKTGAGSFSQITTTAVNATSYSDTGLTKATAYIYRIRSTNTSGDSAYSSEVSVTTANDTTWTPLANQVCINTTSNQTGNCGGTKNNSVTGTLSCVPQTISATALDSGKIRINWSDNSNDETRFDVQKGVTAWNWWSGNTTTWTTVAGLGPNAITYTDTGLAPTTQYFYRVVVYRPAGTGLSNTANATTWALAAPTLNSASPQSATKVNLGWTDNTTDEDGFQIQRGTRNWLGAYSWTTITPNTAANAVSYQVTGLTPNTTYYYRLRTVRGSFYSAYSAIMSALSLGDPIVNLQIGDVNDPTNNPLSDNPLPINALADLRIKWSTSHSDRISGLCVGTGQGWAGDKATSGDDSGGNLNDLSAGTYTYTITCTKTDGGTTVDAVTVTVKNYSITITKAGTGSGSVTPSVGTLSWSGNTGTASYNAGTSITLTATASSDSNFVGWSAPCVSSGTGTCTFTTAAANSAPIVATFTLKNYTFSVTKSGSGIVTGSPGPINCGSTCSASFDHGTLVTLTATPTAGNLFDSWTGCDTTSGNTCTVNVNGAENISASFVAKTLNVSLSASPSSGTGSLTSTLTATVSGTAVGTINYTFYCDRNDDGINVTSPNSGKYDGESAATKSHTCAYSSIGTFYPKVIVERDSSVPNATDKKTVTVTNQAPTATGLTVSSIANSNYCTIPSHALSWTYSDPDGNAESKFQLQVDDDINFGSMAINRTVSATVASGESNSQQAQVAEAVMADKLLYNGTTYHWRVMVWDSYGLASSDWINGTDFKTAKHVFPTVNFKAFPTSPSMNETVQLTGLVTDDPAAITNWTWNITPLADVDYQDGTTNLIQSPRIKFNKTGTKSIILAAKDADGYECSNTDEGDSLQNIKIKLQLPGWKEQ